MIRFNRRLSKDYFHGLFFCEREIFIHNVLYVVRSAGNLEEDAGTREYLYNRKWIGNGTHTYGKSAKLYSRLENCNLLCVKLWI